MEQHIRERAWEAAWLLLRDDLTIRAIAEIQGVSKSTTHLDLRKRVPKISKKLGLRVCITLTRRRTHKREYYNRKV